MAPYTVTYNNAFEDIFLVTKDQNIRKCASMLIYTYMKYENSVCVWVHFQTGERINPKVYAATHTDLKHLLKRYTRACGSTNLRAPPRVVYSFIPTTISDDDRKGVRLLVYTKRVRSDWKKDAVGLGSMHASHGRARIVISSRASGEGGISRANRVGHVRGYAIAMHVARGPSLPMQGSKDPRRASFLVCPCGYVDYYFFL